MESSWAVYTTTFLGAAGAGAAAGAAAGAGAGAALSAAGDAKAARERVTQTRESNNFFIETSL
ncbi:MAG TPA: hypothetical protein DIC34_05050 [Treponema sp.]|nr:hypothetical protein [Treponema sp.]